MKLTIGFINGEKTFDSVGSILRDEDKREISFKCGDIDSRKEVCVRLEHVRYMVKETD